MSWFLLVMKRYFEFSGRSRRKEYWYALLFVMLISIALVILEFVLASTGMWVPGILTGLFCLAIIIPGLAVTIRRLHDINRSGWWYFINFVPIVGPIIFLVFMIQDSYNGTNPYGPNPKNEG